MVLFYARQFKAHGKEIAKKSLSETLEKPTNQYEISNTAILLGWVLKSSST